MYGLHNIIETKILAMSFSKHPEIIVKLTPPQISKESILEELVCTRPMREGKFNISLEKNKTQTIVNCFGHGGSGWTTLFGSVDKAIELFEEAHPNNDLPIRIIGSGCIGLTTAIELKRRGHKVSGIWTKNLYDIPSWKAAGYFALVSVKTCPEEQVALEEIGLSTFHVYQTIAKGKHSYIGKESVKLMPVFCSIDTNAGVEHLEAQRLIPPKEYVALDFGNGVTHSGYIKYMTYFMNTTSIMQQLTEETARLKIPIELKEIQAFDDVPEEIVFNCSGLGGRELNADDHMVAVRGHLVTLNEASGTAHMDYMIYSKILQDGKEEYIYLFPKNMSVTPENPKGIPCHGVLGGDFIPNVDKLPFSEQKKLDKVEIKRLLDRNSKFFQGQSFRG